MHRYGLKSIKNWRNATVVDLETDGFLDVLTKAHVLSYTMNNDGSGQFNPKSIKGDDLKRIDAFIRLHIDNEIPIAGHNFIQFDLVALGKITGNDYSDLMVIDTMALSWVLNTKRMRHGLDHFFEEYGVAKPEVTDWEGLTYEQYKHRCEEDIHINYLMWEDFKERLVDMYANVKHNVDNVGIGGSRVSTDEVIYLDGKIGQSVDEWINQYLTFLMFKMDCAALKEKTMWEVDVENLDKAILEFEGMVEKIKTEVEGVMPKVPKYAVRKEPKVLFKKDGSPTVQATKWQVLRDKFNNKEKDELGNLLVFFEVDKTTGLGVVKELTKVEEPNLDSHVQVKDFLFKNGWNPCTFDSKRDDAAFEQWIQNKPQEGAHHGEWSKWKAGRPEDRLIPKITVAGDEGKELSESVQELAVEIPEVQLYANYSTITHRLSVLRGFKSNLINDKWLQAGVGGFTNTLRQKHRNIVNLPQATRPYAKSIRSNLISGKGRILVGSDLSSLEDRTKNHFMLPLDPEYVEQMSSSGFDPHLSTAVYAGMITKEQMQAYKDKTLTGEELEFVTSARAKGKTCLPVDTTEVLTDSGWKTFNDISLKDKVLSYRNGITEFCSISGTVFYKDQEMLSLKVGKSWSIESTADHRWLVNKRKFVNNERVFEEEYWSTESLNSECNIITSAAYVGGDSKVTEGEAAFIGWYLSDGYLGVSPLTRKTSQGSDGRRQQVNLSLAQKVAGKFYKEMMESVDSSGVNYSELIREDGVSCIKVSSPSAREFLNKVGLPIIGKHEVDYTEWLLGLSPESLKSFFNAFWLGDGYTSINRKVYGSKVIFQNSGNIADAIKLAGELLGMTSTSCTDEMGFSVLRFKDRGHVTMQKVVKRYSRTTDVFCLTTDNGNFIVRQGGVITITGNCNYASVYGAGAATIAKGAGASLAEGKKLHDGYWDLNWAVLSIAKEQVVFKCNKGLNWLINPINGFCYSVRTEKDIFSTLAQGTGSFIFDMWVLNMLSSLKEDFGAMTLTADFHDEIVFCLRDNEKSKEYFTKVIEEGIIKVNQDFKLRIDMGCDVQFGKRYSEIH